MHEMLIRRDPTDLDEDLDMRLRQGFAGAIAVGKIDSSTATWKMSIRYGSTTQRRTCILVLTPSSTLFDINNSHPEITCS